MLAYFAEQVEYEMRSQCAKVRQVLPAKRLRTAREVKEIKGKEKNMKRTKTLYLRLN